MEDGMNNLILNRDTFKLPGDGWYQLAPLGEFAHAGAGVVQVIDGESCVAMAARFAADAAVANFAGLLIDFDHFSMQGGQRSEAAGWITALEARVQTTDDRPQTADQDGAAGGRRPTPEAAPAAECSARCGAGLWAQIRWSDVGEVAVSGGRYRFLSPVWSREDCVELGLDAATGWPRMRPVRLLNAAVTNDPNLKGLVPLSNASTSLSAGSGQDHRPQTVDRRPGNGEGESLENSHSDSGTSQGGGKGSHIMKTVIEKLLNHLGLAADTVEAVVLEKLGTLPALTAVADLQNSLRDLQTKHDALMVNLKAVEGELVNRHLAEFEGIVTEKSRDFWAAELISNRAGALTALTELASLRDAGGSAESGKAGARAEDTRKPLHNRATARPVPPGQGGTVPNAEVESKAMKIRNRAHEIAKAEGLAFGVAFRRAEREVIGQ